MATETDFLDAAAAFDRLADVTRAGFDRLDSSWSSDVVTGGRLAQVIEQTIDATHANTNVVIAELGELADECRRRAVVAAQYAADLATYASRMASYERRLAAWSPTSGDPVPWRPIRPVPPAPWAVPPGRNGG